ncbi:MAG: methylmalonyl-CoA mutase family protein [Myxococcales bacterium]|nr:methylmalonyl-CoA mutase family protein [Myxococcales bacterium]
MSQEKIRGPKSPTRDVTVVGDREHPAVRQWMEQVAAEPVLKTPFRTMSGLQLADLYLPSNVTQQYLDSVGLPGQPPYVRGPYGTMHRGRRWTMRMFAGFGTPEDTNARFRYLLEQGQTGLSTAFDMPTLMGYDPDHPLSRGEVGREGVSVSSIEDMRLLFRDIPLGDVTTSMTINAPAIILLALYVAVAEEQGVPLSRIGGTLQNDILKEFIAQKEWICPPRPSMRIIQDMLVYCSRELPRYNSISISGYHIREAGATAVQELAFTLADGIGYVQAGIDAGLSVDEFAPRLSFFFDVHNDFFEEIAKLRAARRFWYNTMRFRFGAKDPKSWLLRTHCQTAGVSLTAQQPYNNVVRTAVQALAAVLGGTQSLHTNSLDETYALPTEESVKIALRTQQIIADESGVANVVDPFAGSYFMEDLTSRMETESMRIIQKIDDLGGIIAAIEHGFPQREIADSAFRDQQAVERGERVIVGVNKYREDELDDTIPILKIEPEIERIQVERCKKLKQTRDTAKARAATEAVRDACRQGNNLVYPIVEAVKANVTLGEICDVFRAEFGVYRDPAFV